MSRFKIDDINAFGPQNAERLKEAKPTKQPRNCDTMSWRKGYREGAYSVAVTEYGLSLVLPYAPTANFYWRKTRSGHVYVSPDAKAYKAELKRIFPDGIEPLSGALRVTYNVYRPRRVGDLGNVQKVLDDALNGMAWADDGQHAELHFYRHEDPKWPRIEMKIERIREI